MDDKERREREQTEALVEVMELALSGSIFKLLHDHGGSIPEEEAGKLLEENLRVMKLFDKAGILWSEDDEHPKQN